MPDAAAIVVLGTFAGVSSPATTYTPIVGAEVRIPPGSRVQLDLDPAWEHALIGVDGEVRVAHDPSSVEPDAASVIDLDHRHLLYLGTQRDGVELFSAEGATVFLLGGAPFEDDIVMWWNFVGRSHEEIVEARDAWEAASDRFGHVVGHGDVRIPAPPLPAVRLTQRRRRA